MKIGISHSELKDGFLSGKKIIKDAIANGKIEEPSLVLAFCNAATDHDKFYEGMRSVLGKKVPILGGSAVGIIANDFLSYNGASTGCAIIEGIEYEFASASMKKGEKAAGKMLADKLSGNIQEKLTILFYDSIKKLAKEVTPHMMYSSIPLLEGFCKNYKKKSDIAGAGLIGNITFDKTPVQFIGSKVSSKNALAIKLGGKFKPYIKIMHGCDPFDGVYHKITKIKGATIHEIDNQPAAEVINGLYKNQKWQTQHPVSLLTIGVNYGDRYKIKEDKFVNRLITGVMPDGKSIGIFEEDLKNGSEIQFMIRDSLKIIESVKKGTNELFMQIKKEKREPQFGLYIDCAGRTAKFSAKFSNTTKEEAEEVQKKFNKENVPLFGFYSGVEIATLIGKPRGLDWTGVLVVFCK